MLFDEEAKSAIVPAGFEHVLQDPAKRVAEEESATSDSSAGGGLHDANQVPAKYPSRSYIRQFPCQAASGGKSAAFA